MIASDGRSGSTLGVATLVAGLLSLFGSFMIYGTSVWFDPPGWVRIPAMLLFPLGLFAALPLGLFAMRSDGRKLAMAGWIAAFVGIALFAYAIVALGG